MKVNIIEIGNSRGIRIPSAILKQFEIENQVDLDVKKDKIVLTPAKRKPREDWGKAFRLMHERKEDILLIDETIDAEMKGWKWK